MNLYISDLHFGHRNCIKFDNRDFNDVADMDKQMICLWNESVADDDDVYIIGDFIYRSMHDETWYLQQLKGKKHLIKGNHDAKLLQNKKALSYFESIDTMLGIFDFYKGEKIQVILCHYPMVEWYNSRHGSWHIHGHIHCDIGQTAKYMAGIQRTLNASAQMNNYKPVSLEELIKNNNSFREKHLFEK